MVPQVLSHLNGPRNSGPAIQMNLTRFSEQNTKELVAIIRYLEEHWLSSSHSLNRGACEYRRPVRDESSHMDPGGT